MKPADQAVEELLEKYGKLVFHTIYGMVGDWEESQDLMQDTFHQALKGIDAAREASGPLFREKAWLMRIALNTVHMQRRRHGIFRFIPFSSMQKTTGKRQAEQGEAFEGFNERASAVQPLGYGVTGSALDDPAELVAEQDAVQRTMKRLPAPLRECLLLSVVGSFPTTEIAVMLDIQEAAVRQRLARARKQFQRLYTLESGERLWDGSKLAPGKTQGHSSKQQDLERVESHHYTSFAQVESICRTTL